MNASVWSLQFGQIGYHCKLHESAKICVPVLERRKLQAWMNYCSLLLLEQQNTNKQFNKTVTMLRIDRPTIKTSLLTPIQRYPKLIWRHSNSILTLLQTIYVQFYFSQVPTKTNQGQSPQFCLFCVPCFSKGANDPQQKVLSQSWKKTCSCAAILLPNMTGFSKKKLWLACES